MQSKYIFNIITPASNYSTYQDPISGIKLQYPSNWTKIERANYVEFQPPSPFDSSSSSSSSSSLLTEGSTSTPSKTSNPPTTLTAFEIRTDGNLPFDIGNSLDKYTRLKILPQKQFGEFKLIELNSKYRSSTKDNGNYHHKGQYRI